MLATLVPPTVFIAVMALQLRFFKPRSLLSTAGIQVSSQATLDIYSLLPKKVRDTLSKLEELDIVEDSDEENDGLFINVLVISMLVNTIIAVL